MLRHRILFFLWLLLAGAFIVVDETALGAGSAAAKSQRISSAEFHPRRILIKPKRQTRNGELERIHAAVAGRTRRRFPGVGGLQVIEFPGRPNIPAILQKYRLSGAVEYAEPDYVAHASLVPNDPLFIDGTLWGLSNTGQNGGFNDADVDAPEAWTLRHEATNIIVAIIDSGIRLTHEDLISNLWTNAGEIEGNSMDDDGDDYVDDIHGINAINGSGDPSDDYGHGTHVAGIIGALGDNGVGICGVAWHVQLMACKFLDSNGEGFYSDAIAAIEYARAHGATVMNTSWGGNAYSQGLKDAIDAAAADGIIFVAAAGNSSSDNDTLPFYPGSYDSVNLLAVAATTRGDQLALFSNYGQNSVDLGAPGYDITSTWNTSDSAYISLNGTSMATPYVSGALALMRAQFPGETFFQLFNRVFASTDPLPGLAGRCRTGGRLNLYKALSSSSSRPGNDNFTNRVFLLQTKVTISAINVDGTKEAGEPNHAGNAGGKSIWWSWHPSVGGLATISTKGSSFNTLLAVYTGTDPTNLIQVVANDDDPAGGLTSLVTFQAFAGSNYQIAVDGFGGASGSVVLNVSTLVMPVNDNFTNSIAITSSVAVVTGLNVLATAEPGEPVHAGIGSGNSVWWSWTPNSGGPVTLTTIGSDFDTVLAVYTGTALTNLSIVATNDNDPSGGNTSAVDFVASPGTTYHIAVDGSGGATGNIILNTTPFNDHFSDRLGLTGSNITTFGFNSFATKDAQEPNHAGNPGGKSLWWSWTAPHSGPTTISTVGSSFDTLLAVYTGSSLPSLTLIAANDNDAYGDLASVVTFTALAGQTYQIAVDGANGASGVIKLSISTSDYVIIDIGAPPGYNNSACYSINQSNVVVGAFMTEAPDFTPHAFISTDSGGIRSLMTNDIESQANSINDSNQVVGYMRTITNTHTAFLWQNGVVQDLGSLATNDSRSEATYIDNAGRVVGWSAATNGTIHGFLWQSGVMTDLGAVGLNRTMAAGLNGPGLIIGTSTDGTTGAPIIWKNLVITNLWLPLGAQDGAALGINLVSQIVGRWSDADSLSHGFLFESGTFIDLGGVGTNQTGSAEGINNLGQIIGNNGDISGDLQATLFQDGQWKLLSDLVPADSGWTKLMRACRINDWGRIVGMGLLNGYTRGFVMVPVTVPTPRAIIVSPSNHQVFFAPLTIPLSSVVIPTTTNVMKLEYFDGTNFVGRVTNAPYVFNWTNASLGEHAITARTTSISSESTTSAVVNISVSPLPKLSFASGPTNFSIHWPTSGPNFSIEFATNLSAPILWRPVTDAVSVVGSNFSSTITNLSGSRFFRLRRF
jgi:probable HAF family extracellular repeat protein